MNEAVTCDETIDNLSAFESQLSWTRVHSIPRRTQSQDSWIVIPDGVASVESARRYVDASKYVEHLVTKYFELF